MKKTRVILSLLLLSWLCAWSASGWCATTTETSQYMTIPTAQWQTLKTECQVLNSELITCKTDLQRLKKPSAELLLQLEKAEKTLNELKLELEASKNDLTTLSNEVGESKTLLATLRTQIDKERRVHRRQLWQNRIWCIVGGVAIGYAVHK